MKNYAIIGFGCAGYNAARAIRRTDPTGRIVVFDNTGQPPFNPMLTTYYASDRLTLEGVFPFGTIEELKRQLKIEYLAGTNVLRVDARLRTVETEDRKEIFDAILIATGARAFVPGSLQNSGGNVFLMRTLSDAMRLRTYLENHVVNQATVVGASMVGIKVAELLWRRNIHTTMVDSAPYLFPLAAYPSVAAVIQSRLTDLGIRQEYNAQVDSIEAGKVLLGDGREIPTEIVCLCIGTRANVEIAANTQVIEGQGINVRRGIVVDECMRTSCSGIFAAGDCCEGKDLQSGKTEIIGLWANAAAQGECAGNNMAGNCSKYYGNFRHNITHFFDMDFIGLGDPSLAGESYHFEGKDYTVDMVKNHDRISSINILGNYKISGILKNHLLKQMIGGEASLTVMQQELLISQGMSREFVELIGGDHSNG